MGTESTGEHALTSNTIMKETQDTGPGRRKSRVAKQ